MKYFTFKWNTYFASFHLVSKLFFGKTATPEALRHNLCFGNRNDKGSLFVISTSTEILGGHRLHRRLPELPAPRNTSEERRSKAQQRSINVGDLPVSSVYRSMRSSGSQELSRTFSSSIHFLVAHNSLDVISFLLRPLLSNTCRLLWNFPLNT